MQRRAGLAILAFGFVLTGLGCALPGVLLPALLQLWHWNDGQAGRLFLVVALSSAAAPLCIRRRLRGSLGVGLIAVASAACAWSVHGLRPSVFGVVWGFGLGLSMTAISLMVSRMAARPAVALVRINFLWALGACLCPLVATPLLTRFGALAVLRGFAVVTLAVAASLPLVTAILLPPESDTGAAGRVSLSLMLAGALATGVEASGGAWLATYAERFGRGPHALLALPALFWGGLLVSRAIGWRPASLQVENAILRGLAALAACATAVLLMPGWRAGSPTASFALGFALGPLYPQMLARVLAVRQTRVAFLLAGVCSAVLPWATGMVSHQSRSLRVGMLVPFAGALALVLSSWRATREPR